MPELMLHHYAWLVPCLFWAAAFWIGGGYVLGLNRGEAGEKHTAWVVLLAATLALLVMVGQGVIALLQGAPGHVVLGTWFSSGDYRLPISFSLDAVGLSMGLVVAMIALLTLKFSVNYMHRERGFQRFFLLMCLFAGAMELIVLAGNAVLAFVGWEIAGVSSYLLIGYAIDRDTATRNGVRAFLTNRFGDAGFILGIALGFFWLGSVEWPQMQSNAQGIETLAVGLVASGFVIAALAKSAQLPFSSWIARALEGPTPSSAIFYGALMVHAGVLLLIRLGPMLEQAPAVMVVLAGLGLLTAIYGWLAGLTQSDVKSSLMFATTTQVGWMFVWCGMGWFTLAAWHMGLHALWRALQFLASPSLMHLLEQDTRPVPAWLARHRRLHFAALQRFWLDASSDWLLVKPTAALARDVQFFDEQVVTRLVGLPVYARNVSSLAQWESRKLGMVAPEGDGVAEGTGLAGRVMAWLSGVLYWFESRLVLRGGGEGLMRHLRRVGAMMTHVEALLSEPRYLIVLIVITFVVIL